MLKDFLPSHQHNNSCAKIQFSAAQLRPMAAELTHMLDAVARVVG